jgi:hypothetical protein
MPSESITIVLPYYYKVLLLSYLITRMLSYLTFKPIKRLAIELHYYITALLLESYPV